MHEEFDVFDGLEVAIQAMKSESYNSYDGYDEEEFSDDATEFDVFDGLEAAIQAMKVGYSDDEIDEEEESDSVDEVVSPTTADTLVSLTPKQRYQEAYTKARDEGLSISDATKVARKSVEGHRK